MNLDRVIGDLNWIANLKSKQAKELLTLSQSANERADDFRRSALLQEQVKDLNRAVDILREAAAVEGGEEKHLTTQDTEHTEKVQA